MSAQGVQRSAPAVAVADTDMVEREGSFCCREVVGAATELARSREAAADAGHHDDGAAADSGEDAGCHSTSMDAADEAGRPRPGGDNRDRAVRPEATAAAGPGEAHHAVGRS